MSENRVIDTSKFKSKGNVEVDGKIWQIVLPGAGKELQMSKANRRMEYLNKKVEKGEADESDLDKLDSLEDLIFDYYISMFKDSTEDNSEVRKWINETPIVVIQQAVEDIKQQANESS